MRSARAIIVAVVCILINTNLLAFEAKERDLSLVVE